MAIDPLDTAAAFSGSALGFAATGLPAGLSIDPASGVISGTPTTLQTNAVTVTATNPAGSADQDFTWEIAVATGPAAEAGAIAHWLFGADNASNADLVSGQVPTGPTWTQGSGFITAPAGTQQGLDSGVAATGAQTTIFVFRPTGSIIVGGTLPNGGDTGQSPFVFNTGVTATRRGSGGYNNSTIDATALTDAGSDFIFVAQSADASNSVNFVGRASGNSVDTPTPGAVAVHASNIGIGNLNYGATGFDNPLDMAEVIIFNSALTEAEIADVYARSVTRLANRGISVL